jgi:hypothetical protein
MFIRGVFIASLLGIFGYTSMAFANSCSNVDAFSSYDQSGLQESQFGINAIGTFRIAGEGDEAKQPMFNLTSINCENQTDDAGKTSLECKVVMASVSAQSGQPNTDKPNCSLDLDFAEYSMKELQKGVLTGAENSTSCYNSILTIDRNTKRVYRSYTRTKYADNYDKIHAGACGRDGVLPATQVLMNCTAWPRIRKQGAPPRYCDFSSSSDK